MVLSLLKSWAEIVAFIVLVIGFLFSLAAPSAILSYFIIFVGGMLGGRLLYRKKRTMIFPYILICIGFLLGYLIGSRYGDWKITMFLFFVGVIVSYYLHEKGFVRGV